MTSVQPESSKDSKRISALTVPAFRHYFIANCFATFAMWIMRFLLGWTAWALTESAFFVGVASAALLVPTFILSPVFGVVADRINLRTGILVTIIGQGLMGLSAGLIAYAGWLTIEWLLVLALLNGMVTAAHHPMRLSTMPRLISRDLLPSGIGLSAMVFNSSRIVGPALAATMLTVASTGFSFLASALLFLIATLLLMRLPRMTPQGEKSEKSLLADLKIGIRFAAASPSIRMILLLAMINGILGRTVIELLPAISGQLLAGDANTLALLTALAGVGAIAGGLFMSRQRGSEKRLVRLVIIALAFSAIILVPITLFANLWTVSAIVLLMSVGMTVTGTGCQALTQLTVSNELRGRVMSLWTVITMGTPAIGAFVMGALADWLGFSLVLAGFAVLALIATLSMAPQRHRFS